MTTRPMFISALLCAVAVAPAAMAQRPMPAAGARDSMHHDMRGMDGMHRMEGEDGPGVRRIEMRRMGGPGGGMGMMGGNIASMLLGRTGTLKLTDQQVTRLAALARSAESQQTMMRASMDSMHKAMMATRGAGGAPMRMPADMDARMKAAHDQMHANVRDALAVLTPDQLATAWEEGRGGMGGPQVHVMTREMDGGMQRDEERVIIRKP